MLAELIRIHALEAAQAGNWTAVATVLNAQTVEVRNPKSWTMADLITLLGVESAAVIGGTIQAAGATNPIFAGAWLALNITGLQLHTDERQALIDGLAAAGNWPAELTAAVKAAGLTYTSLAGDVVTAEQCQTAFELDELQADETRHEVLLSVNRGTDGTTRVMARVTPVEFADGVELRRGQPIVIANNAELIAALTPIIERLMQ